MGYKERYEELKDRKVGSETSRTYKQNILNGFWDKYLSGKTAEIGADGYTNSVGLFPETVVLNLNTPGYDGINISYPDESFDGLYSSHVLEHIGDYKSCIKEWHRVIKIGGHIVIVVPHAWLYEKKLQLPSNFNGDHKRFYTGASLLKEIEESLEPNTYRVRLLEDDDREFDYTIPPNLHSNGCYQIVLVIQRIKKPEWEVK